VGELLLPRTDTGVLAQLGLTLTALVAALWLVRRRSELRILVVGLATLALALMALRALH